MDAPAPPPCPAQPRLLLVERETAMRHMLTRMLSDQHRVEVVCDGYAACQVVRNDPPDLVIIDLYIPGTDNLPFIRALRADPRTALLPVIILTASADRGLLLRCLAAGANNFLLKPFGLAELLACVRQELELHGPLAVPGK